MTTPGFIGWAWRLLLAIALVGSPVMAMPHTDGGTGLAPVADAMPCHDATPAVQADPPCDEGCCPQPDCAPANCRVAAPLANVSVWVPPMTSRDAHGGTWEAAIPPAAPDQEQLRPPIV
jgi:hypothetical protein